MSVGFRKSLFGFNCDDVVAYVEKTHKSFTEKEIVLNEKIDDLSEENSSLKTQITEYADKTAQLEAQIKEFTDKYDEIERLSQNIGKLYLVAKSNADAIMREAQSSAETARDEVEKNIRSLDNAHGALCGFKEDVLSNSAEFAKKIDDLIGSLNTAKQKILLNNDETQKSVEDYRELIKVLSNE